ncbi:MAG TPA: TerB family tellurite resistance protein [Candidatus Binatia bacterium]|nr:TerB family tellurite resistance protein [Candidatus Binatia bacterium]
MLERLLGRLRAAPHATPQEDHRVAAAVLLLELARADLEHHPAELAALREGLMRDFGVAEETLDTLLSEAGEKAHRAVSLYDFVQALNARLGFDEKRALMRLLWRVARADGRVDPHEEHLLRQLGDLLHLSHGEFIQAKLDEEGRG